MDYAAQLKALVEVQYPQALKILVPDQLNTHRAASLYKALEPVVLETIRAHKRDGLKLDVF